MVKISNIKSYWIKIERDVRQGYVMSPDFFLLYSQFLVNEREDLKAVKVEKININNIRYANIMMLMANTEETGRSIGR